MKQARFRPVLVVWCWVLQGWTKDKDLHQGATRLMKKMLNEKFSENSIFIWEFLLATPQVNPKCLCLFKRLSFWLYSLSRTFKENIIWKDSRVINRIRTFFPSQCCRCLWFLILFFLFIAFGRRGRVLGAARGVWAVWRRWSHSQKPQQVRIQRLERQTAEIRRR